jgi:hypothetical protein
MLDYHPRAGEDAIEPLLLVPDKPGRPRKYSLREILNAIFYVLRRRKLINGSFLGHWFRLILMK